MEMPFIPAGLKPSYRETCTSLDWERNLENMQTPRSQIVDLNPVVSCCEVRVLTAASLCYLVWECMMFVYLFT